VHGDSLATCPTYPHYCSWSLSASPPCPRRGLGSLSLRPISCSLPARRGESCSEQSTWILALSRPHLLPAHELWVEREPFQTLAPWPRRAGDSFEHLLPGPDGLETDCRPKAFSNSLDLVIACPAYVLSGAWKLQLPRNHTREALYSPRRASSVGLKLRLLLRPLRTLDSCRLGAASLACGSMFACLALRLRYQCYEVRSVLWLTNG